MKHLLMYCLAVLCLPPSSIAQNRTHLKPLEIGDTVPDIVLASIFNYAGANAKLSSFKGKLIILDFWSSRCSPCITSFTKMESLQAEFKNDLQILAVNSHDNLPSLKKWGFPGKTPSKILNNTTLPLVMDNEELKELFAHESEPYFVWINEQNVLIGSGDKFNVTSNNIKALIDKKKVNLHGRVNLDYNYDMPIQKESNGRQLKNIRYYRSQVDSPQYYSLIATIGTNKSVSGFIKDTDDKIIYRYFNRDMPSLYRIAYDKFIRNTDRIIYHLPNPDQYFRPALTSDPGLINNFFLNRAYSYEIKFASGKRMEEIMRADLDAFFGFKSGIQKVRLSCLVVQKAGPTDKLKPENKLMEPFAEFSSKEITMINNFFMYFTDDLSKKNLHNYSHKGLPVINETGIGYNDKVNLHIQAERENLTKPENLAILNKELSQFGLKITLEERWLDVLILENK